jgi:hypothetical protein
MELGRMGFAHFRVINLNFLEELKENYSNLKTIRTSVLKCAPHQMQARLITSVSIFINFEYYPVEGQKQQKWEWWWLQWT